ncbi:MAG: leucine-rich repeat protein [Lachnospiraceae bacterium]|nr:leucine-rich repeat protein [Lachnospiraceae bacterium]
MKNGKRIIAILLAAVLVLQSFPLDALASEIQSGTQQEVSTAEEEGSFLSGEEEGESSLVLSSADTEDSNEADTEEEDNSAETGSEGEDGSLEAGSDDSVSNSEETADPSDADSSDTAGENVEDNSSDVSEAASDDTGAESSDDSGDEADSSDFTIEDGVLTAYTGTATEIVIPDTVTEIGEKVFYNTEITSVVLPAGRTPIGAAALYGSRSSTGELTWPDGLTTIGSYAFYGCSGLTGDLVIPDSVTTINASAFYGCSGFNGTLTLSQSLGSIADYAFYNCKNLTGTLTIPDSVTEVNRGAFGSCTGFTKIVFGKNVSWMYGYSSSYISWCPFYGCSGVTEITFTGESVPLISSSSTSSTAYITNFFGSSCFANLTEIVVPADSFEDYAGAWLDSLQEGKTRLTADSEEEFLVADGVLLNYTGTEADVTIPDTVTEISSYAFWNNTIVKNVTCPESVTVIDANAFRGCTALTSFTLPEKLVSIGNYAFYNCTALTGSLDLPETLTTIGGYAFYSCSGLAGELTLPESVTTIGGYAFYGCSSLTGDLVIPDSVTEMGTYVFSGCSGLNGSLTLSASLTEISFAAFNGCSGLTGDLTLPDGLTTIGSCAFCGCSGLTGDLAIPDSVTTISASAFSGCSGFDGTLTLSRSLSSIANYAFYNCKNLTGTLTIPDSVTEINLGAFGSCTGFTGIVIGENVSWMYGYTSTYISRCSFYNCSSVTEITFTGDSAPLISTSDSGSTSTSYVKNFFSSDCFENLMKIVVPADAFADYADMYAPYIQAQTRLVADGEDAFVIKDGVLVSYTGDETAITIPDTVTEIGSRAFQNNTTLISVQFPESVEKIGSYAFYGCTALESVELTDQITEIGSYAFYGCSSLAEMTLPTPHITIEAYTFYNCSALSSVILPETLQKVGNYAFYNCKSLAGALNLPETLESLGSYAFYWCSSLTGDLMIPDAVTEIGDYAFYRCTGFNGMLELPDSLGKIGSHMFYYCNGLTGTLELPETLTSIGSYAFYNCSSLTGDLTIPDSVTTVGIYAFYGCSGFDGLLTLSCNMTVVSDYTFFGCSHLTGTLLIPDSVTKLGMYSLGGCSGLSEIIVGTGLKLLYSYRWAAGSGDIPYYACLSGCSLERLVFLGDVPTIGINAGSNSYVAFFFKQFEVETIAVSDLDAYTNAWSSYIQTGTTIEELDGLSVSNLRTTQVRSRSVTLAWMMAASENVTGYEVYRDGTLIAETAEQSYTDSGLEAGTSYTYTVIGCKESGETTAEASVTVTTVQPQVLSIYTENEYYKVGDNHSDLYAVVQDDGNLTGAVGQFYYLNADSEKVAIGEALTSGKSVDDDGVLYTVNWDIDELEAAEYTVVFELTDADGATGSLQQVITVDDSVPAKISSVTATGDTYQIVLSWGISKEADTETYYIYRRSEDETDYTRIQVISGRSVQSYTDTDVVENTKYYYYVTGVNFFGREGEASRIAVAAATSDTEAPTVVQLTPANSTVIGGETTLYARATDNIQVAIIRLSVSTDGGDTWTEIGSSEAESIKMTLSTADYADGTIQVKAVAVDAADNESDALTRTYTVDNTGPAQVTGLSGVSTATTVTLSWDAVEDADFSFFRVEQLVDGEYVKVQDVSSTLGVNLYNLQANTEYTYRVAAYDRMGNRGEASESVTVATQEDTTAPVITAIGPDAGYYNGNISLTITAEDNKDIASILVQTSANGIIWEDYKKFAFEEEGNTTETITETFDLEAVDEEGAYLYREGDLYIRAIATDSAGNEGDSSNSTAPFVQYIIDRTAPDIPEDFAADSSSGAIVLTWEMGTEEDLSGYVIYRSADGETWEALTSGLYAKTYTDRTAEADTDYQYYLQAVDYAGNISDATGIITCALPEDEEAPQILSCSPVSGTKIGAGNATFSVLVSDNRCVDAVTVGYTVNEEENSAGTGDEAVAEMNTVYTLIDTSGIGSYYKVVSAAIPVADFTDGDVLTFTVKVTDTKGLTSSVTDVRYTIDNTAPQVGTVSAEGENDRITLTWSGYGESDLSGYRVYRRTEEGDYSLIGQMSADEAQEENGTAYQYEDTSAQENELYYYKIEALDACGNTSATESEGVWYETEPSVTASISCDSTLQWDTEYVFDASASAADCGVVSYTFDFGDGSDPVTGSAARVTHTYIKPETEDVEDTSAENEAAAQDASDDGTDTENAAEGTYTLTLTVADAEGNTASVTKTLTVADESLLGTAEITIVDENGDAISGVPVYFDLENTTENIAETNVGGIASFTAEAGRYTVGAYGDGYLPVTKSITVAAGETATLEITMTAQPIVSGEFEVTRMTLDEIIAAGIDVTDPANQNLVRITIHLKYDSETIETVVYDDGNGGGGIYHQTVSTSGGKRDVSIALWIENTVGGDSTDDEGGGINLSETTEYTVALLDVPVEASYLKEFFDVRFYLINNAGSDYELTDNVVSLDVPEGMTLMDTTLSSDGARVTFDSLGGQETKSIEWVLRGDQAGEYDLTAEYSGVLSKFNALVSAVFTTETPITVYGLDAMKLIVEINSTIVYGGLYFNLSLENIGGADIYLPNIDVAGDIVNAYEAYTDEDGTSGRTKNRRVTLLNTLLENTDGYVEYLGTDGSVSALAVGEIFTKKYACYDSVTTSDLVYLKDAAASVAEGYDIEVEIRIVDMNLYSTEETEEIMSLIGADDEITSAYEYFMTDDYYNYYTYAELSETDYWLQIVELLYGILDALFNGDYDFYTQDDIKDMTRQYICEILSDSSFQEAVDAQVDLAWLKVSESMLSEISAFLKQEADEDELATMAEKALSESATQTRLAMTLKTEGLDAFLEAVDEITWDAASYIISDYMSYVEIQDLFADSFGLVCSEFSSAIDELTGAVDAWTTSTEITNQFLFISASKAEAEYLLELLLENLGATKFDEMYDASQDIFDSNDSVTVEVQNSNSNVSWSAEEAIIEEVESIYQGLEEGFDTQMETFVKQLATQEAEKIVSDYISDQLKELFCKDKRSAWNIIYMATKVGFKTLDSLLGWIDVVDQIRSLRVAGCLTSAIYRSVKSMYSAGESIEWALNLKYLIKIRLIGERAWVMLNDEAGETMAVDLKEGNTYFIDSYYSMFKARALAYRDILFGVTTTVSNVPDAPDATIDYAKETTAETFDNTYEYSTDGASWTDCDGSVIALNPGTTSKYIWIRVAASSSNSTGNSKKLYIPARPKIGADVIVTFNDGLYSFSGLTADAYCVFTQEDGTEEVVYLNAENGSAVLEGYAYAASVQLYYAGTASSFAGSVKELSVYYTTDEWTVTPDEDYDYTYDGTEKTPGVTVKNADGDVLTQENDYTVAYTDNVDAGTATITVTGCGDYSGTVTETFTIDKASQAISGADSYEKTYGDAVFILDAVAEQGTALSYTSSNPDVVDVDSEGNVTICSAGSATITVAAAETDNYMAAELSVTITVVRASQTVSGTDSYSRTYGDAAFTLDAKTSGDGTLSYASSDEDAVKVSPAGVVTIQAAGSAIITVTAKASTNYNESAAKTITITVNKVDQTVTASAASSSIKVDTTTLITASGTGTITYTSSDTSVATVNSSGKVTAKAKGTATITVKAAGNSNYNAGTKTVSIKVTALVKGDTFTAGSVKYKLTSASAVTVTGLSSKTATSAKIPATVKYGGVTYSVKAISASAFSGYTKLKTVSVGSKVTSIGSKAFYKCTALTKVTGCTAVTSVSSSAFQGCSKLTTVEGLQKATSIGSKAFYGCTKLKTIGGTSGRITLAKVKTIGSSAFYKCTTLTYVNLTSTALTKIDTSAFQGCTALKTFVSKSTKLTTIGKKAFYGDKNLASITFKTTKLTSSKVGASAFKGIKSTCTFKVPSAKISAYKKIFKAKGAGSKITVKKG